MKIKHHFTILLAALALFASGFAQAQQSVASVHREGLTLFNSGDYQGALIKFQQVLRAHPSYINARVMKSKCEVAIKQGLGAEKNRMDKQLVKVVIPSVDFQQVPLGDALTYIRQRTQELTAGKITPNFIFTGTPEQRNLPVTLKVNGLPVTTLLKYVGSQTRCRINYDEHAVTVTPLSSIPKTVAAPKPEPNVFEKTGTPF